MADFVFRAGDRHTGKGNPPEIATEPATYVGYFESAVGEQWVFRAYRGQVDAKLWGGALNWPNCQDVFPDPNDATNPVVPVSLEREERAWLRLCWECSRWIREASDKGGR